MDQKHAGLTTEQIGRFEKGGECSVSEAAAVLGRSRKTVHRLISQGRLCAWPLPGGKKLSLWVLQVKDMKAAAQARAIKKAELKQTALQLSLF